MKYSFKDILSKEIYDNSLVMFVTGPYSIFNNIVVDGLRERAKGKFAQQVDTTLLEEFGISENVGTVSNSVDFNTFLDVVNTPSVIGRWFCSVDYKMLTKKQVERLEDYMKNPNANGIMVITCMDYLDYKRYLNHRLIKMSRNVNLIQLSFPSKNTLIDIVKKLFEDSGVTVDYPAAELFVFRMSSNYDEYNKMINDIATKYKGMKIDYNTMTKALHGVNYYILDDFITELTVPLKDDKIAKNRKIYKILKSLYNEFSPRELVYRLRSLIDDYIEFRLLINKGIIPIKVKFSVAEVKNRLGEEHRLYKIPDFKFRKMAYTASLTSLRDWVYMKMILNNVGSKHDEESYAKVIYSLVHRTAFDEHRLKNDIGIENVLDNDLKYINSVKFSK